MSPETSAKFDKDIAFYVIMDAIRLVESRSTKQYKDHMDYLFYINEYKTVSINLGRQIGHTTFIAKHFDDRSDVVVCMNLGAVKCMEEKSGTDKRIYYARPMLSEIDCSSQNIDKLWIDEASFYSQEMIKEWIEAFKPNMVIKLG